MCLAVVGLVNSDRPHYHSILRPLNTTTTDPGWPVIRYQHITCTISPPFATIEIASDGVAASINPAVAADLRDCCGELALQDSVAVVTITGTGTGAGNVFAVGRESPPDEVRRAPMPERIAWLDSLRVSQAIAALPMPVIAKLNGDTTGHGLEVALAADIRVAAESVNIGAGSLAALGFPFDGATQRLPRIIGPAHARDLLLTGRLLTAQEAADIGLVNRAVPSWELDDIVAKLANEIAAAAPIASRFVKEAVGASGDLNLGQGLRLEADLSIILHSTDDRSEGLSSFHEKRSPQFTGR